MTGVVITGASAIGPHGHDLSRFEAHFRAGVPMSRALGDPTPHARRSRCREAVLCPDMDLSPWVSPRAARRMSTMSRWAVAAGRMALEAADWADAASDRLAVCLASCFGPSDFVNQLMVQILRESPTAASPFLFTDCVANAPSGQLAIAVQARSANFTISQREAGPLLTLIQGYKEIRGGRADAVLVGSLDVVEENQIAILDRMRALASSGATVRPFDRRRCGILLGEGAGALLVESEASATARGASPLARVVFVARAFDATAPRAGWGDGYVALGRSLREGLDAQGIAPESIDAVVSGASGARAGDRLEARTLREVFDHRIPPLLVPKAVFGEYGSGGTLVPGVLALRGGRFAAPVGFEEVDPGLDIELRACELHHPQRVLLTSLATGGAAAWVVLEVIR